MARDRRRLWALQGKRLSVLDVFQWGARSTAQPGRASLAAESWLRALQSTWVPAPQPVAAGEAGPSGRG